MHSVLDSYRGPELRAADLGKPAGWKRDDGCHDCGAVSPRYLYGRCGSCGIGAVFDHLTPDPVAKAKLAPLREALLIGPRPWAVVDWLKKNPELLIGMGTGAIPISHPALDSLPSSRTTEIIRGRLVATNCLPERNTYAAAFETWLPRFLEEAEPASHRLVLHEYGTWRLLPRMRQPRDSRPQTYSTFQLAKSRIRAARRFLDRLTEENLTLADASQAHVDDFLAGNPQILPLLQPFYLWTTQTRRSQTLVCKRNRGNLPKGIMPSERRWELLRKFIRDDRLDLADRTIGALILTYGLPLTTVLGLRTEDVTRVDTDSEDEIVTLRIGPSELQLAPGLDHLLVRQLGDSSIPRTGAAIATGQWLFPGAKAGQPLSHPRGVKRLRQHGLHPGPGRSRA
ncbi:hypothetical protein ABH924_005054, partial [Arthrobacter sp. GAS37]|uniref:hypothetical protein n=1 Tax=Arthrobacter sp. GAS37 TaxID=3156261 RepID=UPI00383891C1